MKVKTTDDHVILSQLQKPLDGLIESGSWVDIQGILQSKNKIQVNIYDVHKPDLCLEFDKELYNEMIAETIKHRSEYMRADNPEDKEKHWGTRDAGPNGENLDCLTIETSNGGSGTDGITDGDLDNMAAAEMNFDEEPSFLHEEPPGW